MSPDSPLLEVRHVRDDGFCSSSRLRDYLRRSSQELAAPICCVPLTQLVPPP